MLCKNRCNVCCEGEVHRLLRTLGMKAPFSWNGLTGGLTFGSNEDV